MALIYAALIFEYVDVPATLTTMQRNLQPGGTLAALLQLAHADQRSITPTVYRSLNTLDRAFKLVAPSDLRAAASVAGFELENSSRIDLPSGKQFLLQVFKLTRQ